MATEVPESSRIDERIHKKIEKQINIRLDTIFTGIITICRQSTDLHKRGSPPCNATDIHAKKE
jgi:hypothetical protein